MKVVYKKTVIDKLSDEISKATANNQVIDHIKLDRDEWQELKTWLRQYSLCLTPWYEDPVWFSGVEIRLDC